MKNEANTYDSTDFPNFRLVDSNTSSTLADKPAYKFVFVDIPDDGPPQSKNVETGTIVGSTVYWILALIDADQYSNYIPTRHFLRACRYQILHGTIKSRKNVNQTLSSLAFIKVSVFLIPTDTESFIHSMFSNFAYWTVFAFY
jgi:hypothetical protein